MGLLISAVYLLLFFYLIYRWDFLSPKDIPKSWVYIAFVLKLIAGAALFGIYTWIYPDRSTSDTFRYFDDAMVVYSALWDDPLNYLRLMTGWEADHPSLQTYYNQFLTWHSSYTYGLVNDNPTIVRINAFIALFSFGNYAVHVMVMSFLSLIGLTAIFRFVSSWLQSAGRHFYVLLFAFPSILLWSSGVMKEPVMLLFFGLMLYWSKRMLERPFAFLLPVVAAFLLCLLIKPYVAIVALPGLLSYFLLSARKWRFPWLLAALVHAVLFFGAMWTQLFNKAGDLIYILSKKQEDFYNVARDQSAGSVIELPQIDGFWIWLMHGPEYQLNTYFRPFIWEIQGSLQLISALECLITLLLVVLTVVYIKELKNRPVAIIIFSLSFILGVGMLIGSTVPVLGAIVRYKLPGLIFLLLLVSPALEILVSRFNQGRDAPLQGKEVDSSL